MTTYASSIPNNKNNFLARIAIVDIQSVLEASIAIQSVRKSVDNISKKIQQDMLKKETELKEIETKLVAKRKSLSEDDFNNELHKFSKQVNLVRKKIQERKTRLDQSHSEAMGKVQDVIMDIITNSAKKYDIDVVMSSTTILFSRNTLNITNEIIETLNNKLKNIEVAYD
ncbi:MAG: OmpH family outer membrane protein [Rickettsia endosymbiont of Bryobia graminum]|nr:OmpH family outer membrane protein [Rickettsia endosymbiont of Bryobia graminum]